MEMKKEKDEEERKRSMRIEREDKKEE